jgi:hypothetical protein
MCDPRCTNPGELGTDPTGVDFCTPTFEPRSILRWHDGIVPA